MQFTKLTVGTVYTISHIPGPKIVHLITKMKDGWVEKVRTFALYYKGDEPKRCWYDLDKERFLTEGEAKVIEEGEIKYGKLQRIDFAKQHICDRIGKALFIKCYGCKVQEFAAGIFEETEYDERWETDDYAFVDKLYKKGWGECAGHLYCPKCKEKESKKVDAAMKKAQKELKKGNR